MSPRKKQLLVKGLASPRRRYIEATARDDLPQSTEVAAPKLLTTIPPARLSAAKSPAKAPNPRTPTAPAAPQRADDFKKAGIRFDFIRDAMMDQSKDAVDFLDEEESELYAVLNEHSCEMKAAYRW
jgi:hypothetical protein